MRALIIATILPLISLILKMQKKSVKLKLDFSTNTEVGN